MWNQCLPVDGPFEERCLNLYNEHEQKGKGYKKYLSIKYKMPLLFWISLILLSAFRVVRITFFSSPRSLYILSTSPFLSLSFMLYPHMLTLHSLFVFFRCGSCFSFSELICMSIRVSSSCKWFLVIFKWTNNCLICIFQLRTYSM